MTTENEAPEGKAEEGKPAQRKPYEFDGDVVKIPLIRPFDHDGVRYTSVSLRELTVEETLELEKGQQGRTTMEQDVCYFAKMAGKPTSFFAAMKERDWKRVKNIYWETLGNAELEPPSYD